MFIQEVTCHLYPAGQSENIHDLIQRVIDANEDNQGIDWKLAFFELQRITRDTKSALAKPNPIHIVFGEYFTFLWTCTCK